MKTFYLMYKKIYVCINDCCLFRKEKQQLESCPKWDNWDGKLISTQKKFKRGFLERCYVILQ